MADFLGGLIGAGTSLLGGLLNRSSTQSANNQAADQAALNRQMQLDFAKKGIRWRVADAKAAGIHPLYALGASTQSYSPVAFAPEADHDLGRGLADMGQDISRAIDSTRTSFERTAARQQTMLALKNFELRNELLGAQIAKLRQSGPPMAGGPDLMIGGQPIAQDPHTTDAQTFENRYGELSDWLYGPRVWYQDLKETQRKYPTLTHDMARRKFGQPPAWLSRAATEFSRWTDSKGW